MTYNLTSFDEEENIVLTIKKSDIKKLFDGNYNLNIRIDKGIVSKYITKENTNTLYDENYLNLTTRELEVLRSLAKGKTNNQIAKELVVSTHTVKAHVANILQKLNVEDRVQAVVKAITEKIIEI